MSSAEDNSDVNTPLTGSDDNTFPASDVKKTDNEPEKDVEKAVGPDEAALAEWDNTEAANKDPVKPDGHSGQSDAWKSIKIKVKKTWLHRAFIWLVYVTVLVHVAMVVSQLISCYFYWMTSVEGILRCYVIAMSICGILVELELTQFIRESAILRVWITRGLFYSLIGIIAMVENDTEGGGKNLNVPGADELLLFIEIMAYVQAGVGVLYYVMGILCVQMLKNKEYADFERRGREIKAAQKGVPFVPPTSEPFASPTSDVM